MGMGIRERAMAGSLYEARAERYSQEIWRVHGSPRTVRTTERSRCSARKSPTEKVREPELKYLLTLYPVLDQ